MMAEISKSRAVKKQFLERVKPTLEAWGLSQHPNPASYFGGSDYGYQYDFADLRDDGDVKIAAFGIINPGPQLWIAGLRTKERFVNNSDLPIIYGNTPGVFRLTRPWSIFRPLNIRFEFSARKNESNEDAAARLMDLVLREIHKLKEYLYD